MLALFSPYTQDGGKRLLVITWFSFLSISSLFLIFVSFSLKYFFPLCSSFLSFLLPSFCRVSVLFFVVLSFFSTFCLFPYSSSFLISVLEFLCSLFYFLSTFFLFFLSLSLFSYSSTFPFCSKGSNKEGSVTTRINCKVNDRNWSVAHDVTSMNQPTSHTTN